MMGRTRPVGTPDLVVPEHAAAQGRIGKTHWSAAEIGRLSSRSVYSRTIRRAFRSDLAPISRRSQNLVFDEGEELRIPTCRTKETT